MAGQTSAASFHGTTRSTAGPRSQPALIDSRMPGITVRAFTLPVMNRTPLVYIAISGRDGWPDGEVKQTAQAVIALIEGALILSRIAGDRSALDAAKVGARTLLKSA
jgi:hypothetical protein